MPKTIQTKTAKSIIITIDGQKARVRSGISIAAAFIEAGIGICRHSLVSGAPRAPFCMMGICFDCLVTVDGEENQQACQLKVRDKMVIERQLYAPNSPHKNGGRS